MAAIGVMVTITTGLTAWTFTSIIDLRERTARIEERLNAIERQMLKTYSSYTEDDEGPLAYLRKASSNAPCSSSLPRSASTIASSTVSGDSRR